MSRSVCVLILFAIVWLDSVKSENEPNITCPDYFKYQKSNGKNFGKVILPNLKIGLTKVAMQFSIEGVENYATAGSLKMYEDIDKTVENIQKGLPVEYRVEFPSPTLMPKLTLISVNGVDICMAQEYPAPSQTISLTHTLGPVPKCSLKCS